MSGFSGNLFAKRAAALLISAALLVTFASCGSDDKKADGSKKANHSTSQSGKSQQGPNIIEFDDTEDEEDSAGTKKNADDEVVTTTTTTAPSRTKKTTTTASETTRSTTKTTTTTTTTTTKTTTKATTAATQPAPQTNNKYKVVYKNYTSEDGKLKYKYPQISGLYDETMQSFYNEYIRTRCLGSLNDSALDTFKGTYEVKNKTKDSLSIVFRESYLYKGAAHGYTCANALTINLATGNTIIPSESVDMDRAADAITNDTWTLTRAVDGVTKKNVIDYFNKLSEEEIKANLEVDNVIKIRNSGGNYSVSGKKPCNSYLDINGDPVLILEVNHALGDYVEVQF